MRLTGRTTGGLAETFGYDIRGWQTSHTASRCGDTVYSQRLSYTSPDGGIAPRWTGLVTESATTHYGNSSHTSGYLYDGAGRLTDALTYEGGALCGRLSESGITYDPNGNALTVTRTWETAGGPLASLTMAYDGNRLSSVTDSGSEEAGTHSYSYDASGNLTRDRRKRLEFTHNVLNLPMSVRERDASGQHMTGDITYTYLGDGAAVVNLSASSSTSTGAFILEQNGYHPFGTKIDQGCNLSTNRWRYAGKEEQNIAGMDLRLLDFGARFYDPYTLRWNAVDPLAHKYFDLSPYNYCGNDPVNFFDPDGNTPKIYIQTKGVGHVFVSVNEGAKTVIYSYGRYGALNESSGSTCGHLTPKGEGVMRKLSGKAASEYLDEVVSEGSFDVYIINEASDEETSEYFEKQLNDGTKPSNPNKKSYYEPNSKVIDEYDLFTNNCALSSENGVNSNGKINIPKCNIPVILEVILDIKSRKSDATIVHIQNPAEFIKELQKALSDEK